jgi:hypothetical protein
MKKSITNKIEALLYSLYGEPMPQNKMANKSQKSEGKRESEQRRCKNLPFEFIRLLF